MVKNLSASAGDITKGDSIPRLGRQRTPVFLPGASLGQRGLAGYSPWGREASDMTEAS